MHNSRIDRATEPVKYRKRTREKRQTGSTIIMSKGVLMRRGPLVVDSSRRACEQTAHIELVCRSITCILADSHSRTG